MKKIVLILCLFLVFLLSSCTHNEMSIVDDLEGEYHYIECIYLSPLSSSTLDYYPNLYGALINIEFDGEQIIYHGKDMESKTYQLIEFKKEDVTENLDDLFTLDINGVFDSFESRYDIYSDNVSIGLSIFVDDETLYLADTRMIGQNHDVLIVWSVVEIGK